MKVLCSGCGKLRQVRARELCGSCYNRQWVAGALPDKDLAYRKAWIRRRLKNTVIDPATGCWLWQGLRAQGGKYGWSTWHSKTEFMHRASFRAHGGTLLPGEQVRHSCDTPHCWNPEHLLKGTQADNEQDKKDRGRFGYNQGSGRYNAVLNEDKVVEIRRRADAGEKHSVLAAEFGVARPNIGRIQRHEIWKHVA